MIEGQEVVRSTVPVERENGKGHTIGSRREQNNAHVRAAIRE